MSDSKELTALCNAVDRSFLSDRLPYPYTEEDAKAWLNMVAQNDSAFRDLSIERITANIFQPNTTSMQVLRKNGFVHEATLRNAVIKNNEIYNLCISGLTKNYNHISK